MVKYNERIREERKQRKLSQSAIADMLNIKQRTYSDYESGRLRLPLDSLMALAQFYGYSVDYMCGATDEKGAYPLDASQDAVSP